MNNQQLLRYSRHLLLPQVDIEGQEKLLASRVLIVGLGGLGSPVALYLAASGVGELILTDDDQVELSNLQRQIAHTTSAVGSNKAESAKSSSLLLNPEVSVTVLPYRLGEGELGQRIVAADVVVDCTDNLSTRLMVNRLAYKHKCPLVTAAAVGIEGQIMVVDARQNSPCYRCLYDESAEATLNCAESGVMSPLVGVMGSMQALEALKIIVGKSDVGRLRLFDAWYGDWRSIKLSKNPSCPVCSAD